MSRQQRRYSVTPTQHLDKQTACQLRLGLDLVEPENGCEFEFLIDWIPLGAGAWSPELRLFDDSWRALTEWPDVMAWFASQHEKRPPMTEVIEAMKGLGFVDYHARKSDEIVVTPEMLRRWTNDEMPCTGESYDTGDCCCAICVATIAKAKSIVAWEPRSA